jgi:3-oxoadipate enol-lactonase
MFVLIHDAARLTSSPYRRCSKPEKVPRQRIIHDLCVCRDGLPSWVAKIFTAFHCIHWQFSEAIGAGFYHSESFMPKIQINGVSTYYETFGTGGETIVFAHGLLWSGRMFDDQIAVLKNRYRCIAFDFRGQGQTEITQTGYDMETLYADTVVLIESLGMAPCHFVGLSMGGFIGLRVASRRPDLLKSLSLLATSADAETEANQKRYRLLAMIAGALGLRVVAGQVMPLMFGKTFLNDPNRAEQKRQWRERLIANHRLGATRAAMGVSNRAPVLDEISRIKTPTLIVAGEEDAALPNEQSKRMHSQITNSKLVILPRAGHTPSVEEPEAITRLLEDFISQHSMVKETTERIRAT